MIILLHSSKTMRHAPAGEIPIRRPALIEKAAQLDAYLKTLSIEQIAQSMEISPALAEKTRDLIASWTPEGQSPAIDSFTGDIYSGLRANELSTAERERADERLFILSGLYGVLRPFDGICPYRLEMGYALPDPTFANLPAFWGDSIAACLPNNAPIVNLAAQEYTQVVTRYLDPKAKERITAPRFLSIQPKTGKPVFVVVHAKIARGAYARWVITNQIENVSDLTQFDDLGYYYEEALSVPGNPTFVCETFGGKGLSIRLQ